ncbi:enoyl-CoA hydratase [Pontimonas salivibrio]|uniref:enoyl-CoA hydratase n=1 Tax=Pontimonas salivibrio TaxID=1159327 RepID=A0A2L2BRI9_9MICO|nr:enoyl-CoA hydratase/isomerase family protein [Pontimonas salivibrio]AVG24222.1 enoyl-CoA hydratase [Pontimonas salivibrio]
MAPSLDSIAFTVSDGVGEIVLNRPQVHNAMDSDMHRAISTIIRDADHDDDIRVIVVRGEGPSFSSGSDLKEIRLLVGEAEQRYVELDFETKNIVQTSKKPTIALIHGYCLGGGLELALACDIRIASEDAVFGMPEVSLGSLPGSGGLQRLPEVVGVGIATEWVLSGRRVSAQEAYQRGLVSAVHPADELREKGLTLATQLSGQSLTSMRLAKVAMRPEPLSSRSLVGVFQAMGGDLTHRQESYQEVTKRFEK